MRYGGGGFRWGGGVQRKAKVVPLYRPSCYTTMHVNRLTIGCGHKIAWRHACHRPWCFSTCARCVAMMPRSGSTSVTPSRGMVTAVSMCSKGGSIQKESEV